MTRPSVFITGAAQGIGRATALQFAKKGYLVGAYDVATDGLATLKQEIPDLVAGPIDVRDIDSWNTALAEFTKASGGRLDVLVNNAGVLRGGPFQDIEPDQQRLMIDVNIGGVVNGCYAAYPYLRSGSTIVNLASASAIYGQAELATYSATKFAVRGITEALDLEWHEQGISVKAVWPLFVQTQMTDGLDITSAQNMGVRLKPKHVAKEIYRVTRQKRRQVHRGVGPRAKLLLTSSGFAPSAILRPINARIAGKH